MSCHFFPRPHGEVDCGFLRRNLHPLLNPLCILLSREWLAGKLEFAFPNTTSVLDDGSGAVLLRAEISSKTNDVDIDTITILNGTATPCDPFDSVEEAASKSQSELDKDYQVLCKGMIYLLAVEVGLVLLTTVVGNLSLSAAVLLGTVLTPTTALALDFASGSRRSGGSWEWVVINGWQSFSYAGVLSVAGYRTALGALRRVLWILRLPPSLQPRVQTGWAFSGAFHDGPHGRPSSAAASFHSRAAAHPHPHFSRPAPRFSLLPRTTAPPAAAAACSDDLAASRQRPPLLSMTPARRRQGRVRRPPAGGAGRWACSARSGRATTASASPSSATCSQRSSPPSRRRAGGRGARRRGGRWWRGSWRSGSTSEGSRWTPGGVGWPFTPPPTARCYGRAGGCGRTGRWCRRRGPGGAGARRGRTGWSGTRRRPGGTAAAGCAAAGRSWGSRRR